MHDSFITGMNKYKYTFFGVDESISGFKIELAWLYHTVPYCTVLKNTDFPIYSLDVWILLNFLLVLSAKKSFSLQKNTLKMLGRTVLTCKVLESTVFQHYWQNASVLCCNMSFYRFFWPRNPFLSSKFNYKNCTIPYDNNFFELLYCTVLYCNKENSFFRIGLSICMLYVFLYVLRVKESISKLEIEF